MLAAAGRPFVDTAVGFAGIADIVAGWAEQLADCVCTVELLVPCPVAVVVEVQVGVD